MLGRILAPFTTATATGTVLRDLVVALGAILAILGGFGVLSPEQVAVLQQQIAVITDPKVVAAFGVLMAAGMSTYRALWKSSSDKAAEVSKEVDKTIPKDRDVAIVSVTEVKPAPTPGDIVGDVLGELVGRVVRDAVIVKAKKK